MSRLDRGLVQLYIGDGKGKTSAALGLALRAAGHGLRVCFIQFLKGGWQSGEVEAAGRLAPEIEIHRFGAAKWGDASEAPNGTPWWELPPSEQDRDRAGEGLAFAHRALTGGEYDIVVLDEVLAALKAQLISLDEVTDLIRARPESVELVLTGRVAPPEIVEVADLVTEMKSEKHPFERGVGARRGIEY